MLERIDRRQDVLRCLDLETGKQDWTFGYDAPGPIDHDGLRSTPAVSEKFVYAIGPFGNLHCLDRNTHQVVWKKNIVSDYDTKAPRWAVAQSPVLYRDLVVVAPQSDRVGIVALDQVTGQERWRSEGIGPMAYGSPLLINVEGVDQMVIVNTLGAAAVSAADGKVLWEFSHPCKIPIPNVTALGGGKLFITGAYLAGSAVIQVSRGGAGWAVKELAQRAQMGGHCHPAVLCQDHLYLLCNINERSDGMVCLDLEGKVVWQTDNTVLRKWY